MIQAVPHSPVGASTREAGQASGRHGRLGLAILSTSRGLKTGAEAMKLGLGGGACAVVRGLL